jgi:aryl-alcohol dehydrogenase-like predicted oxidoreductase
MLAKVRLGKTNLMVTRLAMGCLPIQRRNMPDAVKLLHAAYEAGVNFYDTAHVYTDSEAKIGEAFAGGRREKVIISSKTMSADYEKTARQIDESLRRLKTDYVDIYQWHNPDNIDGFLEARGPYQAMLDARRAGKIRFVGITNHNLGRAHEAIDSGAFDTMQYPLSVLSSPEEIAMAQKCAEHDMGVIAMKAMCGGLLEDGRLPFAFLRQYPHIVPIWGIQRLEELEQFIGLENNPVPFTEAMRAEAEKIRQTHGDGFCRGCGYCLPCPADIVIPLFMRISFMVNRSGIGSQFHAERLKEAARIDDCLNCRACAARCPYKLNVPEQLKKQQAEFYRLYAEYKKTRGA